MPGGLLAVVTLTVATTLPASVSDHFRSVASNVSGRAAVVGQRLAELVQRRGVVGGGANSTRPTLSAPGTAGSDSRLSTSVSASGAGSGDEIGAAGAATLVVDVAGSRAAGGGAAVAPGHRDDAPKCDSDQRNHRRPLSHCGRISRMLRAPSIADALETFQLPGSACTKVIGMLLPAAEHRRRRGVAVQVGGRDG